MALQKPLGRMTIKKTVDLNNQSTSKIIGLWSLEAKPGSTLERLQNAYLTGIDSFDRIEARAREHSGSGRYTPDGAKQMTLQSALSEAVPSLHRSRQVIKSAKAEVAELRSKIKLQPADKTDMVSAMLRAEMRTWLRSKPQSERDAYLSKNLENLDPQMALAVMELPPEMSGVSSQQHNMLVDRAIEAQHGETLGEIEALEHGILLAERAVEASREEVRRETGVDPKTFDELALPFEAKEAAPWLRRKGNEVRVVDLERGVERLATAEELTRGIEANSLEEFNARKVA